MKILKLRFKNLNSLYGEWLIDFTRPDYTDQGLFAITGPTGSGKSTILDAVCLALYGATPRLGRITKSGNEIMSRQTGECFAEVTFLSQAGAYVCHWHQHRAYRRADGTLAEAVHEIADAADGRILETRKRDVLQVIEEKTGMDFVRFTRSILLAQGGFAAFLQATPDERSPILEQITGTGIYSEISRAAFARQKLERERLQQIRLQLENIRCLDDDACNQLKRQLEDLVKEEIKLKTGQEDLQRALAWHESILNLRQSQITLENRMAAVRQQLDAFKPNRLRLEQAQRALEINDTYLMLKTYRKQQSDATADLEVLSGQLPELAARQEEQQKQLTACETALQEARKVLQEIQPLLREVRALDLKIQDAAAQRHALENEQSRIRQQIALLDETGRQLLESLEKLLDRQIQARQYLDRNAADEHLLGQLAVLQEKAGRWQQLEQLLKDKALLLEKRKEQLHKAEKLQLEKEKALQDFSGQLKQLQKQSEQLSGQLRQLLAGRELREYRRERSACQEKMLLLHRIADLETERMRLEDGQPCPLCGATEHPYAAGQIPAADAAEQEIRQLDRLIEQAEQLEEARSRIERQIQACLAAQAAGEQGRLQAVHEHQTVANDIGRLAGELADNGQQARQVHDTLADALQPFSLPMPDSAAAVLLLLEQLAVRLRRWQKLQRQVAETDQEMQKISAEHERQQAVLQTRQEQHNEQAARLLQLDEKQKSLQAQRHKLLGARQADQEEERLERQVSAAEDGLQKTRAERDATKEQLAQLQARLITLQETVTRHQPLLEKAQAGFDQSRAKMGFADEPAFLAARLEETERQKILAQAAKLDQQAADLSIRLNDVAEKLAEELAKKVTAESYPAVQASWREVEQKRLATGERTGAIKQQLADHGRALQQVAKTRQALQQQEQACGRWDQLHNLVGSADGKKFRNFAQGLTFERMVAQANRQLQHMSDRYLLVRDEERPLELNVMDNYQAGEIRSTKNLSGGESFLVSLALALGLSRMASRNVRVDSLFLDEGFGTLDEDALETALDTLSSLQQEGKLIGVISHVGALKERIRTQLAVVPRSGGRSSISGPGVSQN